MDEPQLCKDFDLSPLISIGPGKLFPAPGDEYDEKLVPFMLGLALVFNDFKGLAWWLQQLEHGRPKELQSINSCNGQWTGFHTQIARLTIGIFHEFLSLLEEHKSLFGTTKFLLFLKPLSKENRVIWNEIITIVETWQTTEPQVGSFKGFLHKIRSKVAFHYDVEVLQRGYKKFFERETPHAKRAYVSLGADMEGTRFFYADAAAQWALWSEFDHHQISHEEIWHYREMVNEPIKSILELFLNSRGINSRD